MSLETTFEGSFRGDNSKIGDTTRLECGICWHVYDPAVGDDVWQIAPGTPFAKLPAHWRCPRCDAEKHHFMVIDAGEAAVAGPRTALGDARERLADLDRALAAADRRMRGLPVHRADLPIETFGFRRMGDDLVGVVLTPWAMNVVILPLTRDGDERPEGSKRYRALPSGEYEFVAGRMDEIGHYEVCSLFSPMDEFEDAAAARAVAAEAASALFEVPAEEEPVKRPAPPPEVSRRQLFTGRPAVETRP